MSPVTRFGMGATKKRFLLTGEFLNESGGLRGRINGLMAGTTGIECV